MQAGLIIAALPYTLCTCEVEAPIGLIEVSRFCKSIMCIVVFNYPFVSGKALLAVGGDELKKAISELHSSHGDLQSASGELYIV